MFASMVRSFLASGRNGIEIDGFLSPRNRSSEKRYAFILELPSDSDSMY